MKQLTHGMFPRFFGAPFGDFGYGGRFPGPHPSDFFPPGHMGFLGGPPHPGLLPSMEQPLPMTMGHSDQFPSMAGDTKPVLSSMTDMAFNMTKAITEGSFMSGLQQQEMGSQEYSVNNCDNANSEDQMIW